VLVIHSPKGEVDATGIARTLIEAKGAVSKPLLACWMGDESVGPARALLREAGIPGFRTPEAAVGAFGKLNVLVNNAGIVQVGPLKTLDVSKWQKVLDVNLTGPMLGIKAVIEPMIAAGGGSIINVSSIEGMRGAVWAHSYVASKWGLRGLTKSAALELAPENIRVNSIHPGFIRTPMTKHLPDNIVQAPMGRPGTPDEVATFVVFLASDESSFSTGSEYVVDGGLIADVPHRAL
jgi:3alpha(or 20beta)-hydroxysteroid dehydrogenase